MMNRSEHLTPHSLLGKKTFASPSFDIESALVALPAHDASRAIFAPLHYEPNYGYPLLVWLHGPGGDERQLMRIMPLVSMRNYVAVAPRGFRTPSRDGGHEGWGWSQDLRHIQAAEQRVFESIEVAVRKFCVAPDRVFLAGFDCGGTMAFRIAMSHPDHFAGVISIGGPFPSGLTPFGQWTHARRLAVFLAVGRHSQEYPSDRVCGDLRLLHTAGMSVTLREYPCGHQVTEGILGDVNRWIIEQVTAPRETPLEADSPSEMTQ
jgi:phospholipase/carboxylesterase